MCFLFFILVGFIDQDTQVVIAATKVIFYAAPPSYWPKFVHPLMRLLMTSKEVERVVIVDLIIITRSVPVSHLSEI